MERKDSNHDRVSRIFPSPSGDLEGGTVVFSLLRALVVFVAVVTLVSLQGCDRGEAPAENGQAEIKLNPRAAAEPRTEESSLVTLATDRLTTIGIVVQPAERGFLPETITPTAVIAPNANRIAHVTSRIPARVVRVFATPASSHVGFFLMGEPRYCAIAQAGFSIRSSTSLRS